MTRREKNNCEPFYGCEKMVDAVKNIKRAYKNLEKVILIGADKETCLSIMSLISRHTLITQKSDTKSIEDFIGSAKSGSNKITTTLIYIDCMKAIDYIDDVLKSINNDNNIEPVIILGNIPDYMPYAKSISSVYNDMLFAVRNVCDKSDSRANFFVFFRAYKEQSLLN